MVLRIANPYGEGQNPFGSLGSVNVFLGKILRNDPIVIWGDGTVARDYFHINDLVDAYMKVLENPAPSKVYNIGGGEAHQLNDILDVMRKVTGRQPRVQYTAARNFDVPVSYLDISLARKELDWIPSISLEDGIGRTWQWLQQTYGVIE